MTNQDSVGDKNGDFTAPSSGYSGFSNTISDVSFAAAHSRSGCNYRLTTGGAVRRRPDARRNFGICGNRTDHHDSLSHSGHVGRRNDSS